MPGAWEQQIQSVLAAVLHTDTTTLAWAFGLRNLQLPGQFIGLAGMPFDHARNVAAMRALEVGARWLFFLDSDVIPPHDAVLRLMSHNQPVVSGLYCRRSPPAAIPVMQRGGQWVTEFPANALIEVDVVGTGCLLIRRDVLENMKPSDPRRGKHWFDWRVDMQGIDPPGHAMSEDFTFCRRVREEMGLKVLVDTSVVCKHIGYAEATYGRFVPLDCTPVT